jgi:hypothetical protein
MPAREYIGWADYHNRTPFRDERENILMAQLLALTANINRNEGVEPFKPADFMKWRGEPAPETPPATMQTREELAEINSGWMAFKARLSAATRQ